LSLNENATIVVTVCWQAVAGAAWIPTIHCSWLEKRTQSS